MSMRHTRVRRISLSRSGRLGTKLLAVFLALAGAGCANKVVVPETGAILGGADLGPFGRVVTVEGTDTATVHRHQLDVIEAQGPAAARYARAARCVAPGEMGQQISEIEALKAARAKATNRRPANAC
jgi:hypothetical protein